MLHRFFSSTSISISPPGSSRMMPNKLFYRHRGGPWLGHLGLHFAGHGDIQVRGGKFHFPSSARMSTLERIGNVVRVPTTFCTACKPAMIWSLAMVRFMRA
jgi:hypothetical protein